MLKLIIAFFTAKSQPQPASHDPKWTAYKANLQREHLMARREQINGVIPTILENIDRENSMVLIKQS